MSLDQESRAWLLAWARASIGAELGTESQGGALGDPPAAVTRNAGCFVTLHRASGGLRGCIGTFAASAPLWENIRDMAVAAAIHDPRFPPLASDELDACVLEISVLTPEQPATPEQVEVGVHGITVRKGARRGVLLPQVASEQGWDRETFLDHTCRKAGLPADAWRDGSVEIATFSAEVFGEPTRPPG